ncbi:hypothetical protein LLH00_18315 [bacterium]|nr:hypothetical protein [bacterium]
MGSLKKPEIQQSSGMSLDSCRVDLTNRCTSDSLVLRLRGENGTKIVPRCTFYPKVDTTVSRQGFKADSSIASLSRDSLLLGDSTAWQNLKINPGGQIASGVLEVLFDISGPAGTEQRKHRIDIKATEAEVFRGETPASKINVELRYKSDATQFYEQVAPNLVKFRGPAGCKVYLNLSFNGQSCGHNHHLDKPNVKATGSFSMFKSNGESVFTLDGGRGGVSVDYTSYGVCGDVTVTARFVHPKYGQLAEKSFTIFVRYKGKLEPLPPSDNYVLAGGKPLVKEHPDNHYGTPQLIESITALAEEYVRAYKAGTFDILKPRSATFSKPDPQKQRELLNVPFKPKSLKEEDLFERVKPAQKILEINDMSLVCGGRFDCGCNSEENPKPFENPHNTHMFGEQVDINYTRQSQEQRDWFARNAVRFFSHVDIHPIEGKGTKHWHCSGPANRDS